MDFFTVPTIRFSLLYRFFVISHDRQQILHLNGDKLWVVEQFRKAFPFESAPRFLIIDRDGKYGAEVPAAIRSLKVKPAQTLFESPCQNGVAERWIESCRRDLLEHIIAMNERHWKRLLEEFVRYYHQNRIGPGKQTLLVRDLSRNRGVSTGAMRRLKMNWLSGESEAAIVVI